MGVTIHYKGRVRDLGRMEELEDRLVDMAFALAGDGRTFRSRAGPAEQVVRGAILDLAPGLDTMSLLVAPDGRFVGFVKTAYAGAEAHALVIDLLHELR